MARFVVRERGSFSVAEGPSAVTEADGTRTPTPEEDGGIMIARLPNTPPELALNGPICRSRRDPVEAW